jgi:hypothetical protein
MSDCSQADLQSEQIQIHHQAGADLKAFSGPLLPSHATWFLNLLVFCCPAHHSGCPSLKFKYMYDENVNLTFDFTCRHSSHASY